MDCVEEENEGRDLLRAGTRAPVRASGDALLRVAREVCIRQKRRRSFSTKTNERVARRRSPACPQRLSFATLPDSPTSPASFPNVFSWPFRVFVPCRSANRRALRALGRDSTPASCRFFSPPLVVPARRRFSTKRRFIPPGERARVLVKASARARPQRTTRRFRRTSGRRRRSPRRPTEPPAPGASVSARLLAARRFARVRVGSRVGKRAS